MSSTLLQRLRGLSRRKSSSFLSLFSPLPSSSSSTCAVIPIAFWADTNQLSKSCHWHAAGFATKAKSLSEVDVVKRAKEVATTEKQESPEIVLPGQAALGDYRSTSALGLGDGITSHTPKWMQQGRGGQETSPLEFIQASEPIKVKGLVVASHGSDDPSLGCPVEYISLKGTTRENPAVCKYTGNKYYSDDWRGGGAH